MSVKAGDVAGIVTDALEVWFEGVEPVVGADHTYVLPARDCLRGFRVTVEEIPFEDVDRLAHPEQYE
jgi:hypothetical protein